MATTTAQRLFSIKEVCTICSVGRSTVKDWIARGEIKAIRLGPKLVRISNDELTRFLTK